MLPLLLVLTGLWAVETDSVRPSEPLPPMASAGPGPATVPDPFPVPVGLPHAPVRTSVPAAGDRASSRTWLLTLDLFDIGDWTFQERHFHQRKGQANLCCLDLAWLPVPLDHGRLHLGASTNLGAWRQTLEADWSHVQFVDLAVGGSALYAWDAAQAGPWIRADLGGSLLAVSRRTTGTAAGFSAQVRLGREFRLAGRGFQLSAGTDWRWWPDLTVKQDPALILSAGGWL